MTMDAGSLVLQHQDARLVVAPQSGGMIRAFQWQGEDILRPAPPGTPDDPFAAACFPMVPFVNRIAHGRFSFGGRTVRLRQNWSEDPHPIHGQGWRAIWRVTAASETSATLKFEGGGDEWPWRYGCEQRLRLFPDALSIELSIENLGAAPMPAMLGLHPYFPGAGRAQLRARLPRVWLTDAAALPLEETATPPAWLFEPPRSVQAVSLDHCFCGWSGHASLEWPGRTVSVRALNCPYLHVYAPAGRDFFCIEPQTGAPGSLGRNGGETSVLAPGGQMTIEVQLHVTAH
ncbi:MAG: aldose 1-epimerase [Steroidobacteraceae bacterium]